MDWIVWHFLNLCFDLILDFRHFKNNSLHISPTHLPLTGYSTVVRTKKLTLVQYYLYNIDDTVLTKLMILFKFRQFSTVSFSVQRSCPGSRAAFSYFSLDFCHLEQFIFPSLAWPWQFPSTLISYLIKCPSIWVCLICIHGWMEVLHYYFSFSS